MRGQFDGGERDPTSQIDNEGIHPATFWILLSLSGKKELNMTHPVRQEE